MTLKQTPGQYEADYLKVNTPVKRNTPVQAFEALYGRVFRRLSQVSSQGGGDCSRKGGSAVQKSNELSEVIPRIQGIYYRQLREDSMSAVCVDLSQRSELLFFFFSRHEINETKKLEHSGARLISQCGFSCCADVLLENTV